MYVQIGGSPEHDFQQPLGLLSDCHRRIEHFLAVLQRVAREAPQTELPDDYRRALSVALTYFKEAAPKHTLDEEESLFPRMRAAGAEHPALETLEEDHCAAEAMHHLVDDLGQRWLQDKKIGSAERALLGVTLGKLAELYQEHIRTEDEVLFPMAAQLLKPQVLTQIGEEMARRRGVGSHPTSR